ncbi:MAG: hypothetical protein CMB37_04960 [Euryarchaeota archaeon]|nr:hypothetical protein [Euryarchaeota archaeon]
MSIHIHKFGGSCLSAIEDIDAVVERIRLAEKQSVVIVSAFSGVTDRLLKQIENDHISSNLAFVSSIELEHVERVPEINSSPWEAHFKDTLKHLCDSLERYHTQPEEHKKADILACGERLSSLAISAALHARGIPAVPTWSEHAGICLVGRGEDATIDIQATRESLSLPSKAVPVITGWYGISRDGFALLGRGGSDLTATALASALDAASVTIWRDVDGVLALSPRWTLPARNLSNLSYTEAAELAIFSQPMLHPSAVEPLRDSGIPLYLRPLHSPEIGGTIIGPSIRSKEPSVRAVGCLSKLVPLKWNLSNAMSLTESVSDAMGILNRSRINVVSIHAQPGHVRLLVSKRMAARAKRILSERLNLPTPEIGEAMSILCFVGEGIGNDSSTLKKIQEIARIEGLKMEIMYDHPRDHAIHSSVSEDDTEKALRVLCNGLDLLTN